MCDNIVARIFKCDQCGFEVRSDWKFCPNCAAVIECTCDQPAAPAKPGKMSAGDCGCGCSPHHEPPKTSGGGTRKKKA